MAIKGADFNAMLAQAGDLAGTGTNISQSAAMYNIPIALARIPIQGLPQNSANTPSTVADALDLLSTMDSDHLEELQHKLVGAGVLKDTKANPIVYGSDINGRTLNAWKQVVTTAARNKKSLWDTLSDAQSLRQLQGIEAQTGALKSNPAAIRVHAANAAAQLNVSLSPQDLDAATAAYQGQEGDFTSDPSSFMQSWLQQNRSQAVGTGAAGTTLTELSQLIDKNK